MDCRAVHAAFSKPEETPYTLPKTQAAPEVSSLASVLCAETNGIRMLISVPPVRFDVIDNDPVYGLYEFGNYSCTGMSDSDN